MRELADHIGSRLAHVTPARNLPSIRVTGIWPAAHLATRAGTDPNAIALRAHRLRLTGGGIDAALTHQKPILDGIAAARRMLDGHDPESWARHLDERVFFWPEARGAAFRASIARDLPLAVLWFSTDALLAAHAARIALSPINSGNFRQGGARARRGDWLFVSATDGLPAFRENRRRRGLARGPDRVAELSLAGGLDPDALAACLLAIEAPPGCNPDGP
ncbi:hypothetical protein SAMN05421759_10717 [Roseivivax lentus]|uniref:Uncharacterized protein n=1 Tax=Roseivivax lentus TaxID=633194 RepID=A0A1N7N6S5_9RHOB|nr:hypothetical protein [Roseivivax lentus]SIS93861.1 hypothetical protein SAMN05421759_10717 [Roseivivax lentus]